MDPMAWDPMMVGTKVIEWLIAGFVILVIAKHLWESVWR